MLLRPASKTWRSFRHGIVVRPPDFVYARHRDLCKLSSFVPEAEYTSHNPDRVQQIMAKYKLGGKNYRELADPVKYIVIHLTQGKC